MKKGYKLCPYCANEIKKEAIKCQYCKEFLENEDEEIEEVVEEKTTKKAKTVKEVEVKKNQQKEVHLVEKRSTRRKWGLFLVLLVPIVLVVWILASVIFRLIGSSAYAYGDTTYGGTSIIYVLKNAINWILGMLSLFGMIGFIPGLAMVLKKDSDYNPYIKLKTEQDDLERIYKDDFDFEELPKSDINTMKYHGFIKNLHVARVVVLNILSFGIFGTFYCGLHHSDLPKIKHNDFTATKGIRFMLIPFFNIYWGFVFRLKLINRINLQFKLRNKEQPISKGLAIAHIILQLIPYVNYVSIPILGSIMVGQIESAVNTLGKENEEGF